ncbi:hypothetical protein DPEC_G00275710 [Dallia pectoralis]|uniref:Uncharacterized protein n=1 Tax=Dallia pectoralis TaxID=75939 RepID=A0ACC2FLA7_DALPE|nr:hypothetical protein DPEC_G00275710 [Dallia pectoralis]
MAVFKWLSICLTLWCLDTSESCRWTTFRLGMLNKQCIDHLSNMGHFPVACLEDKFEGMFSTGIYNNTQSEDVAAVALKTYGYVEQLFDSKLTPSTWNNETVNFFKNCVFRQVHNLKECVGGAKLPGDRRSTTAVNASLKAYFEKLNTVLKEKEHSACAWEVVRKALEHNLGQFKNLL